MNVQCLQDAYELFNVLTLAIDNEFNHVANHNHYRTLFHRDQSATIGDEVFPCSSQSVYVSNAE